MLLCVKNIKAPLRLRNADYQCSALGPRCGFALACCTVRCAIERLTGDLAVALALEEVDACSGLQGILGYVRQTCASELALIGTGPYGALSFRPGSAD